MSSEGNSDTPKAVGGISFIISLIGLTLIAISNLRSLPLLFSKEAVAFDGLSRFSMGLMGGVTFAIIACGGYLGVFLHEAKHAIVALMAGNKPKGFSVERSKGHFEYEYTKETAKYNAFIALAPYWFPLLTIPAFLFYFTSFGKHLTLVLIVGFFYGVDLYSGIKDIGKHQSDLKLIRGGFLVGALYIICAHLALGTTLIAWALEGFKGITQLAIALGIYLANFIAPVIGR